MKFKIYSSLKNKNKTLNFNNAIIQEYQKRLSKYAKCDVYYGNKKITKISKNTKIFLINNDETKNSFELSQNLNNLNIFGISEIIFIFDISQLSNLEINYTTFSVSSMSFSNETTIWLILEQIYRAYKILNNENYHK